MEYPVLLQLLQLCSSALFGAALGLHYDLIRPLRRALPRRAADKLLAVLHLTNNAFSSFVTGQVTEAVILGTLCCLGMLLLGLPYALPVSVIIAALSLIPIFACFWGRSVAAASIFSSAAGSFAGRWHGVLTFCPVLRKKYTFF